MALEEFTMRTRRGYGVNENFVPHASQRMVETAELFARLIHQNPMNGRVVP
jgi:hypothetical protein